ncbi:hypothetical protein FNF27_08073 [Cafeteria roenbergensis]|uniref:Bardet-Biedl syndrome 2 protein homolog n=2 Tax=Cafeteria roenbergensis TaxID=33653 RepID=A0A5A8DCK4_CAFRO|nr:hypothetical protein FNF27_08073 [Cafeteria roenbergensis]
MSDHGAAASGGSRRGLMPAFEFNLRTSVQSGQVAVGKFNGRHPSLACATPGGKVFLHSPHEPAAAVAPASSGEDGAEAPATTAPHVRFLNVNRQVTAVATGYMPVRRAGEAAAEASEPVPGDASASRDLLFVGTASSCLAYDVQSNADVFVADATDGAAALVVDRLPGISPADDAATGGAAPAVVAGGNCSLQAFDETGSEAAWLVTSDQVSAMATGRGLGGGAVDASSRDLLVASEDMELRAFRGDNVVMEATETAAVTGLSALAPGSFAYSLSNGTVGVYRGGQRLWRVKARGNATACLAFDLDADGDPEVLSGWASGKVEARRSDNGALVYRERAAAGSAGVAGLVSSDYRMGGSDDQAVVVGADGTVRGFLPVEAEAAAAAAGGGSLMDEKGADDKALDDLQAQKRVAELRLRSLKASVQAIKTGAISSGAIPAGAAVGVVARVVGRPRGGLPDPAAPRPRLELLVRCSARVQLRCAVALSLDAAVFDGESCVAVPLRGADAAAAAAQRLVGTDHDEAALANGALCIAATPPRNAALSLRVKAVAGARATADRFLSFDIPVTLPEFAGWRRMREDEEAKAVLPEGGVAFALKDRPERVAMWLNRSFLASEGPFEVSPDTGACRAVFVCLRAPERGAAPAGGGGAASAAASLAAPRALPSAAAAIANAADAAAVARGAVPGAPPRGADALAASVAEAFRVVRSGVQPSAETPSTAAHNGLVLVVEASPQPAGGTAVRLRCDSMAETADVLQSLAASMGVEELVPRMAFPAEMRSIKGLLVAVQEANTVRLRLSADLADGANRVKSLVVRAEDARMRGDIVGMRGAYARLMTVNGELAGEHAKRAANHEALMGALRRINTAVQTAARLRLGPARAQLVADCRAALKTNNMAGMLSALQGAA